MPEAAARKSETASASDPTPSKAVVRDHASNEFVFAVVGHVGSGTTKVATSLRDLLLTGPAAETFDTEIIKARELIEAWAQENGHPPPAQEPGSLKTTVDYQNLGDAMRKEGDHASVARRAIQRIRQLRAKKQGVEDLGDQPIVPDGTRRAYIIDSIRHPAEVELLRRLYRDAFVLIGVVCDAKVRLERLHSEKYKAAGKDDIEKFMDRDSLASETYGQRVSDAFHMADYFVDNTAPQYLEDGSPNIKDWDINDNLSRLMKIITHSELVRPSMAETAMHEAYGASLRSACLSRQVGAALIGADGNVIGTGANEVPKAGGGVYGEALGRREEDYRCAFRASGKYCSNTVEQNKIIDELFESVPELKNLDAITKNSRKLEMRQSRVGDLIEFSRAVHAEMDALFSAARKGASTVGTRLSKSCARVRSESVRMKNLRAAVCKILRR
ncbi:MAG: deoxycytidylate deaminase [Xanthobacteraceae bacterium]|nr:deoxycytidylate deaminase [Xanthobacteraceae bacterium]